MVQRQNSSQRRMRYLKWKPQKIILRQNILQIAWGLQFSWRPFGTDFPKTRGRDKNRIFGTSNLRASPLPQCSIIFEPPKKRMRVQQQLTHSRSNPDEISSLVWSKSGAIRIFPSNSPGRRCRCSIDVGTRRTTGIPNFATITLSPASTRSTSLESWVFASHMFTFSMVSCALANG